MTVRILAIDLTSECGSLALVSEPRASEAVKYLKTAGETVCPTAANKRLSMVGQALSPAKCHLFHSFSGSDCRGTPLRLRLGTNRLAFYRIAD